ncbi:hypothetical protein Nepgr_020882 [Nepenthes gracilis]|uniref:non-specific serine/threonine protein kinase n=1 Tax=Nepenthes gracilis TaxID=150966 RepID=A0AAD3SZQ9_NEPGR|nr:hypothetical protein Nepgr_020882 [Nepenthes gracilis]
MGSCWSAKVKDNVTPPHSSGSNNENIIPARIPLNLRSEGEILQSSKLKRFAYSDLKIATANFRPDSLLGEGGFGCVFKGWINEHTLAPTKPGTGLVIAVKRLNREGFQGHHEWLTEINYLGQLEHPNLVRLVGYCSEEEHRLLVYEFMPNRSLENHLFKCSSRFRPLPWKLRMKIALEAAKGLEFLHSQKVVVIFRDFKSSNILLDSDFSVKLSDFGLAKDGPIGEKSYVSTRVLGTHGYAAPEYMATGHLTTRSDVYSFGVVLLEIMSGRRALDQKQPSEEQDLVHWATPYMRNKRRLFRIMDSQIQGQYPSSGAQRVAKLALQCLCVDPRFRPTMSEVVAELEQLQRYHATATSTTTRAKHELVESYNSSRANPEAVAAAAFHRPCVASVHG